MSIYITQQQRTSDTITVNFPAPFDQAPVVLVTPFWKGESKPVASIETVITPITPGGCKISSGNQASDYWVNVLAIGNDPGSAISVDNGKRSLGQLGISAGVHAKMQAGLTTINFTDKLKSNDPVVLLAPQWTSPVSFTECLVGSAASEITTYSQNMAASGAYSIEYLAADRGTSSFRNSVTSRFTQVETGTFNKTGSGNYRVYFQSPFSAPPIVFLSSWWNGTQGDLSSIETLLDVTDEYFDATSGNAAANYFVNWMAFENT